MFVNPQHVSIKNLSMVGLCQRWSLSKREGGDGPRRKSEDGLVRPRERESARSACDIVMVVQGTTGAKSSF